MDDVATGRDAEIVLSDKTGALLMVNKEERWLIRELLFMTLNSENGKSYIGKKLGLQYIEVAQELLKALGSM